MTPRDNEALVPPPSGTPDLGPEAVPEPGRSAAQQAQQVRAIVSILGATVCFAVGAILAKLLSPRIPVMEIVLFRASFAILPLVPIILRQGASVFHTTRPLGHLKRLAWGFTGMFASFYGYANLPIAEVTAIGFTMPLFLCALSGPLLGEKVGPRRTAAVVVGFVGAILIIGPRGAGVDLVPSLIVLGGAVAWAMAMISIRRLGGMGESNATIVLLFSMGGACIAALGTIPVWVTPTATEALILVTLGGISGVAQMLMTAAYRSGETTLVAPFEYAAILWTMSVGWLVWDEVPGVPTVVGVAILIGSGLYILHREVRLGIRR